VPTADHELILRVADAKDNPSSAVVVLFEGIDCIECDDRAAMDPHESIAELLFEGLQRVFDEVTAAGMYDADVLLVGDEIANLLDRDQLQFVVQSRTNVLSRRRYAWRKADFAEHFARQSRRLLQRPIQALAAHGFQNVSDRIGIESLDRVLIVGGGEYDGRWIFRPVQVMRRLDAVHTRHADIEKHHVRPGLRGDVQGLATVGGLADDLVLAGVLQHLAQSVSRRCFVVHDQHPHCPATSSGKDRRTLKASSPFSISTRERLP
jgi:hypothetical protein